MDDLTTPERDVLVALTASMATRTVVTLASDLYGRGRDSRFDFGDPIGFVKLVLEGLAERGLVKYRIREGRHPTGIEEDPTLSAYTNLPFDIRLTPTGWDLCGYPRYIAEVGSAGRHRREVRPGDRTDYRTHRGTAESSHPEVMHWRMHRYMYPGHIHNYGLFSEDNVADRTYLKLTPEVEERVVHAYERLGSYPLTAREVNLTQSQVKYALAKHKSALSLKERTLAMIREQGPFPTLSALYAQLPGPHGMHNFVHCLHSLHKAGLVDFVEDRSMGKTNYLDIKARTNGRAAEVEVRDTQVTQPEAPVAITGGGTVTVMATAEPIATPTYPELERLFGMAAEALGAKRKAARYLEAAELLSEVDPESSESLLQRAAQAETTVLSPVESEYLAYVEKHPDSDDNATG